MGTWQITGSQDEASFFDDHIGALLAQERAPLPASQQRLGAVEVRWDEVAPREAFIQARGGTPDDRLYAHLWVAEQLASHGYQEAEHSFYDEAFRKHADWNDIMTKAQRLVQSGNVQLLRNGYQNVVARVKGDHGTYQSEIFRKDPNSQAITGSDCECGWGEFQNQPRTRQWKQYQDRPCSHVLAAYWVSQATPLDENVNPAAPQGEIPSWGQQGQGQPLNLFQMQPQQPGADQAPGGFRMSPAAPSGQLSPQQGVMPGMAPDGSQGAPGGSPRDVLPQFPMADQEQVNPASIPGARGPTPTNPLNYPQGPGGALSSWRFAWDLSGVDDSLQRMAEEGFTGELNLQNGDLVQLRHDDDGTLVGRSEAHGAGQSVGIPRGSRGEVLGTDPTTGMVNVLYMGGQFDPNGELAPFGAQAWHWPSSLLPRPDLRPPGPAVRRPRGVR